MSESRPHVMSEARDFALQFIYQSEIAQLNFYTAAHFERFASNFSLSGHVKDETQRLVMGVLGDLAAIDTRLRSVSLNWGIERMGATDRSAMRVACFELMTAAAPRAVIINEAIELARKYGTAESAKYVNGVLDALAKKIAAEHAAAAANSPSS